jgi:hypothetical protein
MFIDTSCKPFIDVSYLDIANKAKEDKMNVNRWEMQLPQQQQRQRQQLTMKEKLELLLY